VPKPSSITISPIAIATGTVGEPYHQIFRLSQNANGIASVSISKGTLPQGLGLAYEVRGDNFDISGTPTESGTFAFTVSVVTESGLFGGPQTGERSYSLRVDEPPNSPLLLTAPGNGETE
jgi:hypothetical protein